MAYLEERLNDIKSLHGFNHEGFVIKMSEYIYHLINEYQVTENELFDMLMELDVLLGKEFYIESQREDMILEYFENCDSVKVFNDILFLFGKSIKTIEISDDDYNKFFTKWKYVDVIVACDKCKQKQKACYTGETYEYEGVVKLFKIYCENCRQFFWV